MNTTQRAELIQSYGGASAAEGRGSPAAIERNRTTARTGKVVADFSL